MLDLRDRFKANIFVYCDENIGRKVLFKSFTCLWPGNPSEQRFIMPPQDLNSLTTEIVHGLVRGGVIRVVDKPETLYTSYPRYEILPHEELISPMMRKAYGTFSL